MTEPNPYKPSELPAEAPRFPPGTLTLGKALGFVLVTMVLFATLGALLGMVIGVIMPRYYTQLFSVPDDMGIAAGSLLGLMQGGGVGIAVGVLLSAIIAWMQVRLQMVAGRKS
jgi:hypothetical protein